ncbi:phage tail tape measure protein [Heliorestis acidaminivorans]|uniref:Phage tail tape measure protein n=1 Tax=Heliorestis acidaminivorans TaxID=553427 RepID=A0A6I0EVT9_9FIRM|nr:phage tail tape measure protein [Heliorestis acidaminivorans]KAB2953719.1 phage tail tape measure protein [Heliorestis acidaminivorans]
MSDIGSLTVRIGLDSMGFQNGISLLNREMRRVQAEFKLASAQMGNHGSALDRLRLQSQSLTKQKEIQKQRVSVLEQAHRKAVETKGKDAKATAELEIKLNNAKAKLVQLEQDVAKVNREIEIQSSQWHKLGKSLEPVGKSMEDVGKKMESVGQGLTTKVTLPLAGIGAAAIKIGSDFQAEMSKVQAISGATGEDLEKLSNKAKEMGSSTKFSASQSAEALNYMAMAGWDTNQMLEGLDGVMMLAAASGESLASVSDILTDALTAFGMQASEAGEFADLLASASSNANTNVGMLGESFKYVAPIFGSLGYSAEDAALALGLMANAGIKGSQSGTSLRGAITRLGKPTAAAGALLRELGVSMTDAHGELLPFKGVMDQLRSSFGNLSQEQQAQYAATIFGQEAMSGMLAIINATEEDYQKLTDATRNYNGAAAEMAEIMQDNLQGQLTILKSQLEGVAIEIFEILLPHLMRLVSLLQKVVAWFANLSPATQEIIVKIALLVAALGPALVIGGKIVASAGAVISAFSKISLALAGKTTAIAGASAAASALVAIKGFLAAAFTALTGPIGIAIAAFIAITAVGIALWKNWDTIQEKAAALGEAIALRWEMMRNFTAQTFGHISSTIASTWESVRTRMTELWNGLQNSTTTAWSQIQGTIEANGGGIRGVLLTYTQIYQSLWREALSMMDRLTSGSFSAIANHVSHAFTRIRSSIHDGVESIRQWNATTVREKVFSVTERVRQVFSGGAQSGAVARNYSGTSFFQGGWTMVGELGPELVQLPRGAKIYNDQQTKQMLDQGSSSSSGSGFNITIEQFINNSSQDIERLAYELEFYRQRIALGRGRR